MSVRAAILYGKDDLRIEEVEFDAPREGQVAVRMLASGVCHTQLSEVRGLRGEDRFLPHLFGHEGSGVVLAVGPGVIKVKAGDKVFVSWIKGSGLDSRGATCRGRNGAVNVGPVVTFADEVVVSENRVTKDVSSLPAEAAALVSCAVATGAGMVMNTADLRPGQTVAVFGVGGVGLCAVQAARHLGAGKIIAIDVDDAKLARAKYFGATDAIDSRLGKTSKTIADIVGTAGLDVAIDASGHPSAMECAHTSIRRGGIAIVAGNPPRGTKFAVDPFDLIAGRRLVGSVGGDSVPDRDFPKYATLAEDGAFDLSGMISHQGGLDDLPEFLDALGRGEVTRATIIFKPL